MLHPRVRDPVVLQVWQPAGIVSLVFALVGLVYLRWDFSALVLLVVFLFLYSKSGMDRLEVDRSTDRARFDPRFSLDLQMASGAVVHEPPRLHDKGPPPLLVYPPTFA
jgi:hypothetical protein